MTDRQGTDKFPNLAPQSHLRLLFQRPVDHVQESPSTADVADRSLLILACGNDLRQDDGAGLALARQIAAANPHPDLIVDLICVHQLMPELALEVARPEVAAVLFVDTRVAIGSGQGGQAENPGADLTLTALDQTVSTGRLGHHLNAQMVLLYARELYAKEVPAWLITVPGYAFDHGEGFSPQVQALLAGADGFIAQVYAQISPANKSGN